MPTDYNPLSPASAVTIDVAGAEQALAQVVPGGRPPFRYPGSEPGPQMGIPLNANAVPPVVVDGAGLQKAVFALGLTAALGGAAYLLYQDHQKVSLARNGADTTRSKSKKRRGQPQDDEEDDDDDDG